jgi:prepilin-type N-terminal cleavage/methylation domain-containing protein
MRRVLRKLRAEDGFGLIELLIAMVVLSIGLLSLMAAFGSGYAAINRATIVGSASVLADKKMESFRALKFTDAAFTDGTISSTPSGPDGRTYTVQTVVSTQNAPGTSRSVKDVRVTVSDTGGRVWATEESIFDQLSGT